MSDRFIKTETINDGRFVKYSTARENIFIKRGIVLPHYVWLHIRKLIVRRNRNRPFTAKQLCFR